MTPEIKNLSSCCKAEKINCNLKDCGLLHCGKCLLPYTLKPTPQGEGEKTEHLLIIRNKPQPPASEEWVKSFEELIFASCPTEEKEPFLFFLKRKRDSLKYLKGI